VRGSGLLRNFRLAEEHFFFGARRNVVTEDQIIEEFSAR